MALAVASRYLEESVGSKGLPKSGTRCLFTGWWTCGSVSRLNRGVNQSTPRLTEPSGGFLDVRATSST